ncbi:MAG: DUF2240 family protein [Candidatus Aenigmarchaeota archaeon]|nr:DUF2240 family protein [Candidatus Aenigmarchaeota archaeon]
MIKIPYEEIIAKIKEQTGISDTEIASKVQTKLSQLAGLISKEGAAHIIANELGIKLIEANGKIKNAYPGMKGMSIIGRVQQIYPPKTFQRQDGSTGSVGSFQLADDTGSTRIVCWNDQTKILETLTPGKVVRVTNGIVRENRGFVETHLNEQSKVIVDPPGETVADVPAKTLSRKSIKELQDNEGVELLGTIVQLFNPTFYEICPQCGKRIRASPTATFICDLHGTVTPDYGYVLNVYLDDGTDTIRCVFFKEQAEILIKKKKEELLAYKSQPELFEAVKTELLGTIVKLAGRTKTNTFMNRLELNVNSVILNPDPQEELNRINATQAQ